MPNKKEKPNDLNNQPERKGKPLPYRVQSLTLHLENGTIASRPRPLQKTPESD